MTYKVPTRKCPSCKDIRPLNWFPHRDLFFRCERCIREGQGTDSQKHILAKTKMIMSSKNNASGKKIEHTLKWDDIPTPELCIYLGVKLDYTFRKKNGQKRPPNLATIDRIDPTEGYIPGNIQVISDLANRMKQNASIGQLLDFAKGVLKAHG